jgi:hypothetical protein
LFVSGSCAERHGASEQERREPDRLSQWPLPPENSPLPCSCPPDGSAKIVWARRPPNTYITNGPLGLGPITKYAFSTVATAKPIRQENFRSYFDGDVGGALPDVAATSVNGR